MNDAHLHLLVNHFPIITTVLAIGILITGLLLKNDAVKNTAYILFIVAAIFGYFSMETGEGAEKLVEDMPNIGRDIIHEHEELAEKFVLILYATAIFSALSLITSIKKQKSSLIFSILTLVLSLLTGFLSINVGTSGGEIRHTEIRKVVKEPVMINNSHRNGSSLSIDFNKQKVD
ncbi:DUF2231 domain-containing protein [Flavobacterium sp. K5-23]|uniref:DUF2231 domain-containing protein n=1 Tax=Flavobacterium sp. K5-23 TaxID=2746225 RepID=UPI00200E9DF1|nr:DUF2231 domain-containing protein [Flavobacterium sp. K5-23]UQD57036.1 hypothetical protein FLAK523_11815 [Flavobacterium sp. K5-23]